MKAVVCNVYGPPESLVVEDKPALVAQPGKVVVAVKAANVSFSDTLRIQNKYQTKTELPFTPGSQVSGVVTAIGAGVDGWKVGDRVSAELSNGGYAEEVLVDPGQLLAIPEGMEFAQAAGMVSSYCTAYYALTDRGHLNAGETVLVLGAAGSVGLAAIEIAKSMGAKVIACASSAEKLAVCREHGADETINYVADDMRARVKAITAGNGVDVVVDSVGGPYSELALRDMAWGGRLLVIGFTAGDIPKVPLNLPLIKGCSIVGVWIGAYSKRDPAGRRALVKAVQRLYLEGKIKPHVGGTYPLERAADALNAFSQRKVIGKVVLTPGS